MKFFSATRGVHVLQSNSKKNNILSEKSPCRKRHTDWKKKDREFAKEICRAKAQRQNIERKSTCVHSKCMVHFFMF